MSAVAFSGSASGHQSGCHSNYSCPSDHHTYIWYDSYGQGWGCAASYAPEYNPAIDTQGFYDSASGMQWYCHAAGYTLPPTTSPPPSSSPPPPSGPDLFLTASQARSYVRTFIRQSTHRSAVNLHSRCSRLSSQKFRCQPDWRESGNAYAGTATIWTYASNGQGYWTARFRGLKASLSCLDRHSVHACTHRVSF